MKKIYFFIFISLGFLLLNQCKVFERINALRIVETRFVDDLLNAEISAEIIDTEKKSSITEHGFCYAAGYASPTLDDAFSNTLSLGPVNDENQLFTGKITRLEPNTDYYIRAYMIVGGKVVYSSPKFIRTRDFVLDDFNLLVTNAILSDSNQITVTAFVNKKRIETRNPVTIWQYGSIVAAEPDSTNGLSSTYTQSPPEPITYFIDNFPISVLPSPSVPSNSIFIWAYADIRPISNPNVTFRLYSRRRRIQLP
jgi:hypothetical protein